MRLCGDHGVFTPCKTWGNNSDKITSEKRQAQQLDDRELEAAFDDAGPDGVAGEAGYLVDVELGH
jgi:hypothetical protein